MSALTAAMEPRRRYTAHEVADLCRIVSVFMEIVGDSEDVMHASHRSAFGKVLGRFADRRVGNVRFVIEGKGHQRRYRIEQVQQGNKVEQGISPNVPKHIISTKGVEPCLTLPPC
jgi:hypothetical protein